MKINEQQVAQIVRRVMKEMWNDAPTDIAGAASELHELATQLETVPNLGEDEKRTALKSIVGQLRLLMRVLDGEVI